MAGMRTGGRKSQFDTAACYRVRGQVIEPSYHHIEMARTARKQSDSGVYTLYCEE